MTGITAGPIQAAVITQKVATVDATNVSLKIDIPSEHKQVFFPDENVKARVSGKVCNEAGASVPLTWRLSDYYGKTVREDKKEVQLDTTGSSSVEFIFSGLKPGFYVVRAELKAAGTNLNALSAFAVVDQPVGIEKGRMPFCGINWTGKGGGRIGSKWIQIYAHWNEIEKNKGAYDWSSLDKRFTSYLKEDKFIVDNPKQCRVKLVMPWLPQAPEWAWDKEEALSYNKTKEAPKAGHPSVGLLPGTNYLENWSEFVRQMAERYKDRVDIFEIGAEDDGTFAHHPYYLAKEREYATNGFLAAGPAFTRYTDMLSTACREIRKAAPNAKIGVIRPCECTRYTFTESVLRHCGTNLDFDALPLDPYTSPRHIGPGYPPTAVPETYLPEAFNKALDLCKKYGRGQPVYVSELGYQLSQDHPFSPDSAYARELVQRLARAYLVARMTKGVELMHWWAYFENLWQKADGLPLLPTVPAYSAVARVVENVLESRDVFPVGNAKAVVFRKNDRADAAIWLINGEGKIIFNKIPDDLTIADVVGSPMPKDKESGKTILSIGGEPVYLNLPGTNGFDRLCDLLAGADVRVTPLILQFAVSSADKGMILLHNQTAQGLKTKVVSTAGDLAVTNEIWVAKGDRTEQALALPAAGKHTIKIEADCGPGFEKVAESFSIGDYLVCKRITAPVAIDGGCAEWTGGNGIAMNRRDDIMPPDQLPWNGTNDLSAIVWTGWDEKNFYFAAEAWDDLHFNDELKERLYNGDSFQFALAPLAASDISLSVGRNAEYDANDTEAGLALIKGEPKAAQWHGISSVWRTGQYAVKRDETAKITRYEAAIPWITLGVTPKPGKVFGFNFVIFDDDTGAGKNYWYQFSPGITGGKNPALFKRFILGE